MKMVLLDAEFIQLFIDTKTSKNKCLFAKKSHFCDEYSKWAILAKMQRGGDFGINEKVILAKMQRGGPLAFWPKWPIFMAQLWKPRKIGNTHRILVKMVLLDKAEFILLFIDTKTSKNKRLFAEKWSSIR